MKDEHGNLYLFACVCGMTLCGEPDTFTECCEERVRELLAEDRHEIELRGDGWTISHPFRERFNGTLLDCPMRWEDGDVGVYGRFWLEDDGTLGERLAEET